MTHDLRFDRIDPTTPRNRLLAIRDRSRKVYRATKGDAYAVIVPRDGTLRIPYVEAVSTRDADRDVVFVPNARARLRISAKKVSVFIDHIAKARHYGTIDGFGEYDLDADLPDDVADAAKQAIDGSNGSA